jgi:hypothetical protein
MNLVDMMKIAEAGHELLKYCKDFYCKENDGLYADIFNFTEEEIVDAMSIYFKDDIAWKEIAKYGADSVDRENIRNIVLKDIRGENPYI